MTPEQRAIIALAEKEGVSPVEKDARLIVHGMVNATRTQMRKYQVGYDKMGQAQQDSVLGELTAAYDELAITIARALASASTPSVIMTCKDLKVSNGTFTAIVESDQAHYNDLISKVQDKGEIVAVLYERQFRDAMETIEGDRDQKSLPLDSAEPKKPAAAKATTTAGKAKSAADIAAKIVFTPEQLEKAKAFVEKERVPTTAGIQNILSVGFQKAEAILAELARQGVIVQSEDGYAMPALDWDKKSEDDKPEEQAKPETAAAKKKREAAEAKADLEAKAAAAESSEASGPTKLTDDLYELMKAKTIKDQKVSAGGLAVAFDTTIPVADEAIDRMEIEGTVSDEDEMGQRIVFEIPE